MPTVPKDKFLYVGWGLRDEMPSSPEQNYCREFVRRGVDFDVFISEPLTDHIDHTDKKIIQRYGPKDYSLVHVHHNGNSKGKGILQEFKFINPEAKRVFTPHSSLYHESVQYYDLIDAMVVFTEIEKKAHEALGFKGKIFVNPNGLWLDAYESGFYLPEKPMETCKDVLYVGQIARFKGVFELARACRLGKHKLVICTQSAPDMVAFEDEFPEVEIKYCPKFEELVQEYLKRGVLVLLSKHDCYPTVILEAMRCRLPVIASNVGGIPEMVHTEYLLDSTNPAVVSDKIDRVLGKRSDDGSYYSVGDYKRLNAMIPVKSIVDCVGSLLDIYSEVLSV